MRSSRTRYGLLESPPVRIGTYRAVAVFTSAGKGPLHAVSSVDPWVRV